MKALSFEIFSTPLPPKKIKKPIKSLSSNTLSTVMNKIKNLKCNFYNLMKSPASLSSPSPSQKGKLINQNFLSAKTIRFCLSRFLFFDKFQFQQFPISLKVVFSQLFRTFLGWDNWNWHSKSSASCLK